jgi:hypothetical protein
MWIVCGNVKLCLTKHWGFEDNVWIFGHFRVTGHNVPDLVRKVIGLGMATSPERESKGRYHPGQFYRNMWRFYVDPLGGNDCHHSPWICVINESVGACSNIRRFLSVRWHHPPVMFSRVSNGIIRAHVLSRRFDCRQVGTLPQPEWMFIHKIFFFFLMTLDFFSFRYRHTNKRKVGNKKTWW